MNKRRASAHFEAKLIDDCLDSLLHIMPNKFIVTDGCHPGLRFKKTPLKKKDTIERNWKFTVSNQGMINFAEIGKDISRENPLICIREQSEETLHRHYLIHESIIRKAEIIFSTEPKPFTLMKLSPNLYLVQYGCLSEKTMIDWVKAIKNRDWKEHGKKASITVGVPKI